MIDIYFYNITKRLNSTARPTGTGVKYECLFKENTSILNPVLTLRLSTKPDYNYFKIDDRYYWVTDIVSLNNDRWQISGRIDALATFKGHISATSAFVLYDSTANTQLPDARLAIKTDCDVYTATASMPWDFDSGNGTYLIATTGNPDVFDFNTNGYIANQRAGTGVYTIPYSSIERLGFDADDITQAIYNEWSLFTTKLTNAGNKINQALPANPSTDDILEWIGKKFEGLGDVFLAINYEPIKMLFILAQCLIGGGNALENVKACYWLPFVIPSGAVTPTSLPLALGTFPDTISGLAKINKPVITSVTQTVAIPWHYTDWRNVSCTEVFLYIPLIGCIAIPSEVVKGHNSIEVKIALNLCSGAMAVEVLCGGAQIGTYGANTAMPYLIGDSNINMATAFNTVVNAAAQNYAGAVASGMQTMVGMQTSVGGIGGGAGIGLSDSIVCICRCHDTSQEPSALLNTIGTPTNQLKTLSGSGFCQCMNAQMNCGAVTGEPDPTQTEIELVNNYLNTGVYLE